MARVPGRPDYCPKTVCMTPATAPATVAGNLPPGAREVQLPTLMQQIMAPGAGEPYVCRECRAVRLLTQTEHDDETHVEKTCPVCKAAGNGRTIGKHTGITTWVRIRTVPEYQMNKPAGSWMPHPDNRPGSPNHGIWIETPEAYREAEVARRIATI